MDTTTPQTFDSNAARPFGRKCEWYAIATDDLDAVSEAFMLTHKRPGTWDEADPHLLELDDVLVSPPVTGPDGRSWVLLAAVDLEINAEGAERVAEISEEMGTEVQAFTSYRVSDGYGWFLAREGEPVRGLMAAEGLQEWIGAPTPVELELGLTEFAGVEDIDEAFEIEEGLLETLDQDEQSGERNGPIAVMALGEDDVLRVAAAWSVDPARLLDEGVGEPIIAKLDGGLD